MTLQGLNFNKFISRVMYFNVAKLKLHLSSKWSKIKGQKISNLFFEYKKLESSGQELWTDDGYWAGYCRAQGTAGNHPKPIPRGCILQQHPRFAASPGIIPSISTGQCPRKDFFPGFSHSQTENSTKSGMQAQSSASACFAYTQLTQELLQGY